MTIQTLHERLWPLAMKGWLTVLLAALPFFLIPLPAGSDEFADIDPKQLERSINKLAESWALPTVGGLEAIDEGAKTAPLTEILPLAKTMPIPAKRPPQSLLSVNNLSPLVEHVIDFDFGIISQAELEALLGAIERRRRD